MIVWAMVLNFIPVTKGPAYEGTEPVIFDTKEACEKEADTYNAIKNPTYKVLKNGKLYRMHFDCELKEYK